MARELLIKNGRLVSDLDANGFKIKNLPGGGTQVQADWEETDQTSPAFIQNKPSLGLLAGKSEVAETDLASALANKLNGKYTKPAAGIPASDLATGVIPAVPSASTDTPLADGTASAGSSAAYARGDHRHPTDNSRAAVSDLAALAQAVAGKLDAETSAYFFYVSADGHLAVRDAQTNANYLFGGDGAVADGVARGEDLPYATGVVMDESEGVYYPMDRAVNSYEATDGDTTLTLNMPQPMAVDQGGRARDFVLDVDNSANTGALGLEFEGLGEDYALAVTDGDDLAEITELAAGERARFYFTETSQQYTPTGAQDPVPVISVQRMTIEVVASQGGA